MAAIKTSTSSISPFPATASPLDMLLQELVEQASSARARIWARKLRERGFAASGTSIPPSNPPRRRNQQAEETELTANY